MKLMDEETFGPVVGLVKVAGDDLDAVVGLMNKGDLGLTAGTCSLSAITRSYNLTVITNDCSMTGVYSKDKAVADKVLSRLDVGTVYWNRHGEVQPWMPWSGRRMRRILIIALYGRCSLGCHGVAARDLDLVFSWAKLGYGSASPGPKPGLGRPREHAAAVALLVPLASWLAT